MTKRKILFITSANLACNPRLLKEVDCLRGIYNIKVILFKIGNWTDSIDAQLRTERKDVEFQIINFSKSNLLKWAFWAIIEKIARFTYILFSKSLIINSLAHGRRGLMILSESKEINSFDLIIGHNLTALYPTYKLSNKYKIPFIFDIEDYEPGMQHVGLSSNYSKYCKTLMIRCLPKAIHLTYASPLIGNYSLKLIGSHQDHHYTPNSFYKNEFVNPIKRNADKTLKFVWYSQTISFNRGLEEFLASINNLCNNKIISKDSFSITLIGRMDDDFSKIILNKYKDEFPIIIYQPLPQIELHKQLSDYDIGLALEIGKDLNYNLAITNKIMGYLQAGLFVLASNTLGQQQLMQSMSSHGLIFQKNELLENTIESIFKNREQIQLEAEQRYLNAQAIAYDNYNEFFKQYVAEIIYNRQI